MLKFIGRRLIQIALLFLAYPDLHFLSPPGAAGRRHRPVHRQSRASHPRSGRSSPSAWGSTSRSGSSTSPISATSSRVTSGSASPATRNRSRTSSGRHCPGPSSSSSAPPSLAYVLGFTLGKVVAWRRGRGTETAITVGGVLLYTVFYPWFAIMMLWLFGFITRMVPHRPVHHDRGMERRPFPGQPGLLRHDPLGADRQRRSTG